MNKRINYHLNELKNELRKRALKEKEEKKRRDYWRLYYKAVDAVHEVDSLPHHRSSLIFVSTICSPHHCPNPVCSV